MAGKPVPQEKKTEPDRRFERTRLMVGLGGQEILLLLCCGAVPVLATVIVLAVTRRSRRTRDPFDDDFDDQ